jgi:multidrug transporter EmrE-like cation transporter
MSYFYIFLTIVLTVYGQLIIKWQVTKAGALPDALLNKITFLFGLFLNPWIASAFVAAFLASLFWMAAMTKLPLSHAYPFMSLAFVLVLIASGLFFHEPITALKIAGILLIALGIIVGSQG